MFKNLKIQSKLLVVIGIMMLLGMVIVGWSLLAIIQLDELSNQLVRLDQEGSDALGAGNAATRLALADLSSVLSFIPEFINDHSAQRALLREYLTTTRQRTDDAAILAALARIEANLPIADDNWAFFYPLTLVEVIEEDYDFTELDMRLRQNAQLMSETKAATDEIYAVIETDLEALKAAADFAYLASLGIGAAALGLFLAFSVFAAMTITRSINAPMVTLIDAARSIEQGAFDPQPLQDLAKRTDEIGRIARSMLEMAQSVDDRRAALTAEAADLRAKLA